MTQSKISQHKIDIRAFKDIHIRFPGDVYLLAVWLVLRNLSRTTATSRTRTLLLALAGHLATLHGNDGISWFSRDAVMNIFKHHGITGNPALILGTIAEENELQPLIERGSSSLKEIAATMAVQICDSKPGCNQADS
ncbi:MAG: hypothetical protein ACKO8I_15585 [Cyanobacteriota bacterium]